MDPKEPRQAYSSRPTPTARVGANGARRPGGRIDEDLPLLERMAAGDDRALAELYDRRIDGIHAFVLHLVRDADDAEDVVEETFWQAWRQAGSYDRSRGSVGGWLTTIARSRALDRVRARGRRREDSLNDLVASANGPDASMLSTSAASPLEQAESADAERLVRSALAQLPAEQRESILLAYYGGLSQTEIAARTGDALGTVKTRTRLALRKLRDLLGDLVDGAAQPRGAAR